ncbi:MAG: hypothetical protein U9Q83_06500 [Bacteroidota bacterium]|nr:hypothetical protein [Bacteroidota bacterium]
MISTKELIKIIINNSPKVVETQLILDGAYTTHFTYSVDGKVLIDEGIDGEKYEIEDIDFFFKLRKCLLVCEPDSLDITKI